MAKKGMKVLLISRTESKLVDTKAEIKKAYPSMDIEHLAIDYSDFNDALQASLPAVMVHVCETTCRVMLPILVTETLSPSVVSLGTITHRVLEQAKVATAIVGKDVGVLINNVGVSYSFPKYFNELKTEEVCHR